LFHADTQIIIDTNVLVAGLRSKRGRAFELLSLVGTGAFDIHLSVPLVLEYEEVLLRERSRLAISESAVQTVINYHCATATHHEIFFLWRPYLPSANALCNSPANGGRRVVTLSHHLRTTLDLASLSTCD